MAPWTVAYQAPPSIEFSRQEYWIGLPLLSPGDLPDPGIKPGSPTLQADTLPSEQPGKPLILQRTLLENLLALGDFYQGDKMGEELIIERTPG